MSTILKALRRLEQEKAVPVDRPLREQVTAVPEPQRPRRAWPAPLAALLLGAAVGASALFLWPRGEPARELAQAPPAPTRQPEAVARAEEKAARERPPVVAPRRAERRAEPVERAAAPAPVAVAVPPERTAPQSQQRALSAQALSSDVEVVRRPEAELRIAEPEEAGAGVEVAEAPPPGSQRPVAHRLGRREAEAAPAATEAERPAPASERSRREVRNEAPKQVAAAKPRPEPSPPKPPAPKPAAKAPPAPAASGAKPAPSAAGPASAKVRVEKTRWHPRPERREAMVALAGDEEPQLVHEGDRLGGLRVSQIRPAGVLFERDGVEFERKVGAD